MKTPALSEISFALLRLVTGLLFMMHGGQKLLGWFGGVGGGGGAPVHMASVMGIAALLELVGGTLVMLGLITRPIAFLLSGEMAFAYFTAHQPHGIWPIQNHGELAVLYCFIFLFMAAHGAGVYSLHSLLFRGRHTRSAGRPLHVGA